MKRKIVGILVVTLLISTVLSVKATVNHPPDVPTIIGETNGKTCTKYNYTFCAVDPDGDDVFYKVCWGDGLVNYWFGPFESGEEVILSHSFCGYPDVKVNEYCVCVRAKDTYDSLGAWGHLHVNITKSKSYINTPFLNFLENHPHLFPLLRQLLELK